MADQRSPAEQKFDALKARLRHAIVLDVELSASARIVGYLVADLIGFEKGYAWPGQEYLAEELGVGIRTVRDAQKRLTKYFDVEVIGRGHRYHPRWDAIPAKSAGVETNKPAKSAGVEGSTPAKNYADTGKKLHGTPAETAAYPSTYNLLGTLAARRDNQRGPSHSTLAREYARRALEADRPNEHREASDLGERLWTSVKARLGTALFNRVEFVQIYEREVMLEAPSEFVRSRIEGQYRSQLERAWANELGHPVAIAVLAPLARAAE